VLNWTLKGLKDVAGLVVRKFPVVRLLLLADCCMIAGCLFVAAIEHNQSVCFTSPTTSRVQHLWFNLFNLLFV
jgi:hypothetical protein